MKKVALLISIFMAHLTWANPHLSINSSAVEAKMSLEAPLANLLRDI
jgi:hypothetical protein